MAAAAAAPKMICEQMETGAAPAPRKRAPISLNLTADEVLSTTRAVRKRLDPTRPVPRHLIEECVDLATQAPTGRNRQRWHPLAYTLGTEFRPAARVDRTQVLHWNRW